MVKNNDDHTLIICISIKYVISYNYCLTFYVPLLVLLGYLSIFDRLWNVSQLLTVISANPAV